MAQTIIYQESTEGLSLDRICRQPGFSMPSRHFHGAYEIYYLVSGERHYFIGTRTYDVSAGSLVFIDRFQPHKTTQLGLGSHDRILVNLEDEPFSAPLASTGELFLEDFFKTCQGVLPLKEGDRAFAEGLLDEMAWELKRRRPGYRLAVLAALSRLLVFSRRLMDSPGLSLPPAPTASVPHRKVDEAARFITDHCCEPLSLEDVAGHLFLNKSYLSRIFKQVTGFKVSEYIHMNRIKKAQELLAGTSMGITEISETLGYDSITYFERVFKRSTGLSPARYRRARKKKEEEMERF